MSLFAQATDAFLGDTSCQEQSPAFIDLLIVASKVQDLLKGQPLRSTMRVALLAGSVAKHMDRPLREVHAIVYASLVYDLGLATIAEKIAQLLPPDINEKQVFASHTLLNADLRPQEPSAKVSDKLSAPTAKSIDPDIEAALADLMRQDNGLDQFDAIAKLDSSPANDEPILYTAPGDQVTALLKTHPRAIIDFLRQIGLSEDVRSIVASHHELCDGTGYPEGLKRNDIPLGARILSLADALEATLLEHDKTPNITSRQQAALNFLKGQKGGKFDRDILKALEELLTDYPDFLKLISGRDVEPLCKNLVGERQDVLSGKRLLTICQAIADLVDNMAPSYRNGHSKKVSTTALKMAGQMGINREQAGELLIAAMLHDIGMASVPAGVLSRAGKLTDKEWQVVKDHPYWVHEILKSVPGFSNIAVWAAEHHERLNGRGYPLQRRGDEISIGGRIIALADVFNALTSPRAHRGHAFEPLDALPIIGQGRHTQFDNQLTSLLRTTVMESELAVAK